MVVPFAEIPNEIAPEWGWKSLLTTFASGSNDHGIGGKNHQDYD